MLRRSEMANSTVPCSCYYKLASGVIANQTQKPLLELEFFIRLCRPSIDAWIVDLTCGSGSGLIAGLRMGRHVAGYDVSQVQVDAAQARVQAFLKAEVG